MKIQEAQRPAVSLLGSGQPAGPARLVELPDGDEHDGHEPSEAELAQVNRDVSEFALTDGVLQTGGVIDVHVHVINKGQGVANGDISLTSIHEQMEVLNDRYEGTGWSFRLVDVDRTTNASWYEANRESAAEVAMKTALHEGSGDDLNVYFSAPSNAQVNGWGRFPWQLEANPLMDGVVIQNRRLPGASRNSEGETLVHEAGHWLGLLHTFQGGCSATGDRVDDTPAELRTDLPGTEGRDTCPDLPGLDPIHNFMTYGSDLRRAEFTPGQNVRMDEMFTLYRAGR
jgi:hypothetical protein